MLAKIAESGLTPQDARRLRLRPCLSSPPDITLQGAGFVIPYFNRVGDRNGFYRYRFLDKLLIDGKEVKYSQPADKTPEAYFSPLFPWKKYLASMTGAERRLLLTEGENKGSAGAKLGLPVIGLGGVYNYAKNHQLIEDLDELEWQDVATYIVYDSDAVDNALVMRAEDGLASLLTDRGAVVHIVRLPGLVAGKKAGLDDYLVAKGLDEFLQLLTEAERWDGSPRVFVSEPLHRAVTKAEYILAKNPAQKLFVRGSGLVRVVEEKNQPKEKAVFKRPLGNTYLSSITALDIQYGLAEAQCVFSMSTKKGMRPDNPPWSWCAHIVRRITSMPEDLPWRRLELVTPTPLLLADGRIVDQPGYHEETGVWFDPRGVKFPEIPKRPTKPAARAALDLFSQVFGKFPFASDDAYAAVLSTILSVLLRHQILTVPMLGISAPEPGSGKTKIAEAIGAATTGCLLPRISFDSTEEFDKHIPVPLRDGDRIILIDNVDRKYVRSARLSGALTTEAPFKWRVLGASEEQAILNRSVLIATGNHLVFAEDFARRVLFCRLTPDMEAPETRKFDFDPVKRAREMFPQLVGAALTALRYYLQAGCPQPKYAKSAPLEAGSFEEWNRVARGLLVHLGFGDPLATQQEARSASPFLESDTILVQALCRLFPDGEVFTVRMIESSGGSAAFAALLGAETKWNAARAGFRIRRLRDRVLSGLKVELLGHRDGVAKYRVVKVKKEKQ